MEADIEDARVRRLAFRAYGCPYVIAACSRATELLTGAAVEALDGLDPAALAQELNAPPEKLGNLLVIQDALRNCFRDWDTTQPAAAR
jgi:NifU-like protein involved in Fe-S cluster formation